MELKKVSYLDNTFSASDQPVGNSTRLPRCRSRLSAKARIKGEVDGGAGLDVLCS